MQLHSRLHLYTEILYRYLGVLPILACFVCANIRSVDNHSRNGTLCIRKCVFSFPQSSVGAGGDHLRDHIS